ncbi:hypothetical protein GGF31_003912 [Allomyces arbusculus]|nr:hypothetical protein GGF31_003912 [Allomyces arbusculus]
MAGDHYEPVPDRACVAEGATLGAKTGFVGLVLGAATISWNNSVPKGSSITRVLATTTTQGAALGAIFAASACAFNQYRHKEDEWGSAFGGLMTGLTIGLHRRSFGAMAGFGAGLAFAAYLAELNKGTLRGPIGNMTPAQRRQWHNESFWPNPATSPAARALEISEAARQQKQQQEL